MKGRRGNSGIPFSDGGGKEYRRNSSDFPSHGSLVPLRGLFSLSLLSLHL